MDDGDLGDTINNEDEIIESTRDAKFFNDDAHLEPTRWWFASSAFPMIAGTLGPVASAFSICALVRPWRQQLPLGTNVEDAKYIADPSWLTIVNALQLVVALISNVFLLLNMARRVRFSIAQPITIVGWYISAICLIALSATAAGPLLEQDFKFPRNELIWSQAFFYGIWAAILYFIDASLMVVTFYGASIGRYDKDFMLTPSQRTLMLQTIMFLVYLLLGALVFCNIEDWYYLDAVYWADVTLFTVGFGEYHADTTLGRALMMPYALVGVISLGLVIGSIRSLVLDRGKRRLDARMEEKNRRKLVRSMTRHGKDEILEPIRSNSGLSQARSSKLPTTEFERRKAEFALMRQVQARSSTRRRWMAMAISTGSWLILWLLGAFIFVKCEEPYQDWSYFEGFYFCFVSLTTIGYGDITPVSNAGKSFFVFWSLLALPTMTVLISNAGDTVVRLIRDGTLRLGNVTILPGEEDFTNNVKHIVKKTTFGKFFPRHTMPEVKPVDSNIGTSHPFSEAMTKSEVHGVQDDARGRAHHFDVERDAAMHQRPEHDRTGSTFTAKVRRSLSRLRDPLDELPTGTDFHFLLATEIQVVTGHLKKSKPCRYTFDQWAWYLKLIGEDERSAETHGKAKSKSKHQHKGHHGDSRDEDNSDVNVNGTDRSDNENDMAWSWVGNRSPLMGSQEESEWILDRLTERLRESLSAERRRQLRMPARAHGEEHHPQPHQPPQPSHPHHHWDTKHHQPLGAQPNKETKETKKDS
ncbi:hypothetical protein EDB81DRAFT_348472 [Dactylonectria macrodidyma]|uniref:Potassium channel domain-containing protein n=1 Tax=Dactylonectria macrodidyma TaxID=307937 RepID=A0A9P9JDK8_9HYPO|nr:hypothetical protein EDB81DRAFT_348472 [Dactylonectria macrodidyma]